MEEVECIIGIKLLDHIVVGGRRQLCQLKSSRIAFNASFIIDGWDIFILSARKTWAKNGSIFL
ncbi:hypothetical protein HNY42_16180 (plasmid) [Exiguobacterium sp. Helios]|nr:hypothetical protein HNY42_16180 [Exiguobacterium sp. Helios]